MNKKLTREEAIRLHRKMWQDMRAELGDDPCKSDRLAFKKKWVEEHFPNESVRSNCFLCEYARHTDVARITDVICYGCPIAWNSHYDPECAPGYFSFSDEGMVDYRYSPISVILALPERKEDEDE